MKFLDPKPLQIANYVLGKVKNFQGRSVGKFCEIWRLKVGGGGIMPLRPLRVQHPPPATHRIPLMKYLYLPLLDNPQKGKNLNYCLFTYRVFLENGSLSYRPSPEQRSHQLIMTLYTLSIYSSVHNQLMRTLFEGRLYMCTLE